MNTPYQMVCGVGNVYLPEETLPPTTKDRVWLVYRVQLLNALYVNGNISLKDDILLMLLGNSREIRAGVEKWM